jgi:hypothetical protein
MAFFPDVPESGRPVDSVPLPENLASKALEK